MLQKTGRTATQGMRDDMKWTDNVWELPEEPGSYRAVVVVSGRKGAEEPGEKEDEGKEEKGRWMNDETPDQTWAIVEVVQD